MSEELSESTLASVKFSKLLQVIADGERSQSVFVIPKELSIKFETIGGFFVVTIEKLKEK